MKRLSTILLICVSGWGLFGYHSYAIPVESEGNNNPNEIIENETSKNLVRAMGDYLVMKVNTDEKVNTVLKSDNQTASLPNSNFGFPKLMHVFLALVLFLFVLFMAGFRLRFRK